MDFGTMNVQLVVPKVPEVSQIQHNMNQAGAIHQSFETIKQKQDAALKERQVRTRDRMEDGRIKDNSDREGRGGYQSSGRRHGQEGNGEPAEKMAVDTFRGHNIDIQG